MKKNKFFLALSTLALSAVVVGVASAGTFDNTRQAAPAKSVQHQVYMTQQDSDAMIKAMDSNQHKVQDAAGQKDEQVTTQKKGKKSDSNVKGSQTLKMGPQLMGDKTFEQMEKVHQQNQETMKEIHQDSQMANQHKSMPQSDMHQAGEKMNFGGMMR